MVAADARDPLMSAGSPEPPHSSVIETPAASPVARAPAPPPHANALEGLAQSVRNFRQTIQYRLSCYVLSHLQVLKTVFAILRVVRPVMIVGNVLVVTKAREVREVLERFDDFVLGESIEPGMPWGPFLMTVDWREQHARERQMLQSAVDPATDLDTIRTIAADVCRSRIEALAATGRIDVVADLAEPVMVRIFADYFGIPPLAGDGRRMASVMRHLAGIIMVNPSVGSQAWLDSRADIVCVTRQLMEQLAAEKAKAGEAPTASPQTLLTRLVRRHDQTAGPAWFDEDWIRRYLTGLIATGGATIVRGTAHAVDQLLERPDALRRAQMLSGLLDQAEGGDHGALSREAGKEPKTEVEKSRDVLRQCIYEALRFRPMLPLLVRDCPRDTIIANGTPRARLVPAGTRVIAPPLAAMFDPDAFPDPSSFRERPIESYFHFGFGPRHCFGKYIADIAMLEIVHALMRLPGLARAAGSAGQVTYDGPAPSSLVVTFEPRNRGATR
ncbi:MAG: Cytochrome [Tardiphaga sp.]|nr:Cytochrome [Tardiphaga sp.]